MFDRILKLLLLLGLGALVFTRPLVSGLVYPASNYIFFVGAILLVFVYVLRSILRGALMLRRTSLDLWHLLFFAGVIVSWFYSINPYEGLQFFLNLATAVLIYGLVVHLVEDEEDLLRLVALILVTASVVSFFGVYQYLFGLEETREWVRTHLPMAQMPLSFQSRLSSPRIFSTFVYPNALAGFLLSVIPLSVAALWIRRWSFHRWVILFCAMFGALIFFFFEKSGWAAMAALSAFATPLLYLATFLLTLSKGGFLAFFFVRVLGYWLFAPFVAARFRKIFFWGVILAELGMGIVFLNVSGWLVKVFPSLDVRLDYWRVAFAIVKDFPLWGTGPGTFGSAFARYKLPFADESRMAHNNFLQVASETGLAAGAVFLLIWMMPLIRGLWRCRAKGGEVRDVSEIIRRGALLGFFALFVHGLIDFDLYEPALAVQAWLLLAMLSVLAKERKAWVFRFQGSFKKAAWILAVQALVIGVVLVVRIPYRAHGDFTRALAKFAQKKSEEALSLTERSLKANPLNPQAHYLAGMICEGRRQWGQALGHFEAGSRYDSLNPSFPYRMAMVYERAAAGEGRKDLGRVERLLKAAVENYPTSSHYHLRLASFYERVGRKGEALLEYIKARELGMDTLAVRQAMRRIKNSYKL